jgi:V-type H+-transporting ATPase subunit a
MGILRSEAMKHGTLVLPTDSAKEFIELIGQSTAMQFEDMNARDHARTYKKYIQRIDEMERILRFLFDELARVPGATVEKNNPDDFLLNCSAYKLDEVEVTLKQLYTQFVKFKDNNSVLQTERNQTVEEKEVVAAALQILAGGGAAPVAASGMDESFETSAKKPMLQEDALARLGYLAGVVPKADEARFARALFRASRGNTFTQFSPIHEKVSDPKSGLAVDKSVFVIYFQGASGAMQQKIQKVCSAFGVNMYGWPADRESASRRLNALTQTLAEKNRAMEAYQSFMKSETFDLVATRGEGTNSKIEDWRLFCIKEKSVYSVLNMCSGDLALCVNVWYPADNEEKIKALLKEGVAGSSEKAFLTPDRKGPKSSPPTYIRTNEYTQAFQEVVDTYGIPKYQEANPALLATVSFPFIFGMMYGDIGHGSLLLMFGIYLCRNAESLKFTQPVLYMARFMILSLGIFALYAGFMYNDFFSIGLQLFESGFVDEDGDGVFTPTYDVTNSGGPGPYPFGLDWAWVGASNELLFVNSMKMKLSVLFGVLQMFVGVLLRWSNAFYRKNMVDFVFECIPMMVFLLCFFGWMDAMILYKWVYPMDQPPSIINSLICMAMGQKDNFPLWDGSVELAQTLMKYTVCAVPFMLFPKPFIILYQHNQEEAKKASGHQSLLQDEESGHDADGHGHGEEFEFGEIFIHQIIETIEFVLGTVSHTASYLRIWALSLAHQQLSLVFFQKTLTMGLEMPYPQNGIVLYIMFAAWFGITLGVLLGMDVLECFLHTLRLHWVEFQSKFYNVGGSGEKFAPYDIKQLVSSEEA